MLSNILLQSGKIGSLTLKNRLVMTPANLSYATSDGKVTPRLIEFYRRRAQGGVGLIIVGAVGVDPLRINTAGVMQLSRDSDMEGMKALVDAIHLEGGKVFPQLWHPGAYAKPEEYGGQTPVAPSEYVCNFNRATTHKLENHEIEGIVQYFGDAARRAKNVGFDGVEIVGSAGYIISQFLSAATNSRTDQYGGCLSQRMTFLKDVYTAVREAVGNEYPVTFRLAGNEFVPEGNDNDACIAIAKELECLGVDAVSITGGWHETRIPQVTMDVPHGGYSYLAKRVKEAVSIPVFACNRMNIDTGAEIVSRGDADFIGFCRGFISDPDIVKKLENGTPALIRPCVGCNQGCMDNIFKGKPLSCLTNSEAGNESDEYWLQTNKRILVIGAGVAGMEYALKATENGAKATIWEKSSAFGGQMDLVSSPPGRESFWELPVYQYNACMAMGVQFEFNKEATAEEIISAVEKGAFDRVVVATGANPIIPAFPTEDGAHVVSAWDVLRGKATTGKTVVVVGGGAVGVETSLKLAEEGTISAEVLKFLVLNHAEKPEMLYELLTNGSKKITIVEMQSKIGKDIGPSTKWIMMSNLKRYNVGTMTDSQVLSIKKNAVVVAHPDGKQDTIPADSVVLAIGSKSETKLAEQLKDVIDDLVVIGDAVKPRKALDAIEDVHKSLIKSTF